MRTAETAHGIARYSVISETRKPGRLSNAPELSLVVWPAGPHHMLLGSLIRSKHLYQHFDIVP